MTSEEQKAIYNEIHLVEVRLMKDNEDKHNDVIDKIHQLSLNVKEHNGIKKLALNNKEDIDKNCGKVEKLMRHLNFTDGVFTGIDRRKKKGLSVFNVVIALAGILMTVMMVILTIVTLKGGS